MSKVKRIKAEIAKLSPEEVCQITVWLAEYDAKLWDRQIEEDSQAGRLDFLFEEAAVERKQGTPRTWPSPSK